MPLKKIKGFTLLELLVVIVIVGIVSALAFPNFSSWKRDREVRVAVEKIINSFRIANTQAQGGYYPFTQVEIREHSKWATHKIWVKVKGLSQDAIANKQNAGQAPRCSISSTYWGDIIDEKIFYNISLHYTGDVGAVCFSKDGSYYQTMKRLAGRRTLIICHLDTEGKSCSSSALKKPAYMIEWSRFGSMNKYIWSGSAWTKQ